MQSSADVLLVHLQITLSYQYGRSKRGVESGEMVCLSSSFTLDATQDMQLSQTVTLLYFCP